jgi:hypothetical protein
LKKLPASKSRLGGQSPTCPEPAKGRNPKMYIIKALPQAGRIAGKIVVKLIQKNAILIIAFICSSKISP